LDVAVQAHRPKEVKRWIYRWAIPCSARIEGSVNLAKILIAHGAYVGSKICVPVALATCQHGMPK
jgi:hypothetical protein